MVAASLISITLHPLLYKLTEPTARWLSRYVGRNNVDEAQPASEAEDSSHRAVVVGYGPVGKLVVTLLVENGLKPTVVELNHETAARLRSEGISVVYGDASQSEILERAGVRSSGSLVFTALGSPDAVIRTAKDLNPQIRILTRTTYLAEARALREAGAHVVVAAEAEVALGMTVRVLEELGATADQLDRARDRVRQELVESGAS